MAEFDPYQSPITDFRHSSTESHEVSLQRRFAEVGSLLWIIFVLQFLNFPVGQASDEWYRNSVKIVSYATFVAAIGLTVAAWSAYSKPRDIR